MNCGIETYTLISYDINVCAIDIQTMFTCTFSVVGLPTSVQVECTEEKLSPERWYVLIMFALFTLTQGGVWNTWGPIADSASFAFGWKPADIALLANWGPIAYLVSSWIFAWILDVKGKCGFCYAIFNHL